MSTALKTIGDKVVPFATREHPDAYWREMTRLGNAAFTSMEYERAARAYDSAWRDILARIASVREGREPIVENIAAMLVITAANIADNSVRLGDSEIGVRCLRDAITLLIEAMDDPSAPQEWRETSARNFGSAVAEYLPRLRVVGFDEATVGAELTLFRAAFDRYVRARVSVN